MSRLLEGFPGLGGKAQGNASRLDGGLSLRCSGADNRKESDYANDFYLEKGTMSTLENEYLAALILTKANCPDYCPVKKLLNLR